MGTNTMQMDSVETSAGTVICCEPSRIAGSTSIALLEMPVDVLDGHRRIIDQDAHRQRQAAQGHEIDGLADRAEQMIEARIDSGMEMVMIRVLRQLPRNSSIISAGQGRGDHGFRTTPLIAARTKIDWSPVGRDRCALRHLLADAGQAVLDGH